MYFDKVGKDNTDKTLELAIKTAKEKNIKNIVVASSSGNTALKLSNEKDLNIVCVSHSNGFRENGSMDMPEESITLLKEKGIKVLTTTHVLSGAERGLSKKFGGISPVEVIAYTLRMFGQGVKVCTEISIMALDSNLIPYDEPIIAIGGSSYGADTAIIIRPSHASSILETKIDEIICKPIEKI